MDELNILKRVYNYSLQYREDEYEIIQKNLSRIEVIDSFLLSVKDEYDIKIFSPRREEDIYREKIQLMEKEKKDLKEDNKRRYLKVDSLNKQIEDLDVLIKKIKNRNEDRKIYDVLDIQEKERQRIASDLHDSTTQSLIHLIHTIELSSMYIDKDPIRAKLELESCISNLRSSIDEMRQIIFNLRPMPFDDFGFKSGIDNFIANMRSQYGNFQIEYDVCDLNENDFCIKESKSINLFIVTVYRIIQEAVTNAIKHSKGEKIILIIDKEDNNCVIHIRNDGKGFIYDNNEKNSNHFGLIIMKERIELLNGDVSINTDEFGTEFKIKIPLN